MTFIGELSLGASRQNSEGSSHQPPNWLDKLPYPLDNKYVVVDNHAIGEHFTKVSRQLRIWNIPHHNVLHIKAMPFDVIEAPALPKNIAVVSSFEDWRKTAEINKKRGPEAQYALHFGTPSHEQDKKDRLITTPTLQEFKTMLEVVIQDGNIGALSKIILDGTYPGLKKTKPNPEVFKTYLFDILQILREKDMLEKVSIELKIDSNDILSGLKQKTMHGAVNGLSDFREWFHLRRSIATKFGNNVKVGANLYVGNPNSPEKIQHINQYLMLFRSLIPPEEEHLLPSTIAIGGFKDVTDHGILYMLSSVLKTLELFYPSEKKEIIIEHGSNLTEMGCISAVFPDSMKDEEIVESIPDIRVLSNKEKKHFIKNHIHWYPVGVKKVAVVNTSTSYLDKQAMAQLKRDVIEKKTFPLTIPPQVMIVNQ